MADRVSYTPSIAERLRAQVRRRQVNLDALIEGPLVHLDDDDLEKDVHEFSRNLPDVVPGDLLRAARIAREIRAYTDESLQGVLPEPLTDEESKALKAEREKTFSQGGMKIIIITVALAALLQGHVQASINAGSVFASLLRVSNDDDLQNGKVWKLGAMNAAPYLAAALLGAPLSLPLNYWMGRRGAIAFAASFIFASSLASAFIHTWDQLLGVRIINGIGMGVKAVSTPILASETAVDHWRGSSVLMWQLWVAFGIMMGSVFNLVLVAATGALSFDVSMKYPEGSNEASRGWLALRLILAAPMVPAVFTLIALAYCMESPRFYMQRNTPNYRPMRAYEILSSVRNTKVSIYAVNLTKQLITRLKCANSNVPGKFQALRDIYLIHKNNELEEESDDMRKPGIYHDSQYNDRKRGLTFASHMSFAFSDAYRQYSHLLTTPRLRNAVLSTCTVALAQQLCGINVFAFYSNDFFIQGHRTLQNALLYSFGFGAVNFVFGLLAIRSIDNFGRRRWLLVTLPLMFLLLGAAALSFNIENSNVRIGIVALFIFLFAAVYSPGLGPIPFTLASESFPMSQRESGCSVAISVNLFFAGILTIVFPSINETLKSAGTLSLFAGLNVVAFVLVFLIVEETKQISLEELSQIYAVPKWKFMQYQVKHNLPYLVKRYIMRTWKDGEPPTFYTTVVEPYHIRELRERPGDLSSDDQGSR
ncbi:MFS monosaccharide transporter [Colletotrichum chrysophilum]|uniref:MFS monosaccharide transporter n=1 Tax=Colletotrichum chrysophilum TaxID=1836956 RepID=A0AAD9AYR6_9PEZI|nr:MFS monosaccharide transporter [Colletotrichum chrysophilum]